jgi:hypothetical protein
MSVSALFTLVLLPCLLRLGEARRPVSTTAGAPAGAGRPDWQEHAA